MDRLLLPCDNSSVSLKFFQHWSIHKAQFDNQLLLTLKYLLSSFLLLISTPFAQMFPLLLPDTCCFQQILRVYIKDSLYISVFSFSHFCSFNFSLHPLLIFTYSNPPMSPTLYSKVSPLQPPLTCPATFIPFDI